MRNYQHSLKNLQQNVNLFDFVSQLDRYVAVYGGKRGGLSILNSQIGNGEYEIRYYNYGNGLIIYNFKRKNPDPAYVKMEEREKEKATEKAQNEYTYEPQIAPSDLTRFMEIMMGVGIASGTLVEDVGTGGLGIADDIPSFMIAAKLVFGI